MENTQSDNLIRILPPPPEGKTGWPWTEESDPLRERMPDGKAWPKISIVTPSYNQGEFLEETIRSVLLQNYPNLEYIIIDDGSKDNSVAVIKKYDKWITHWETGPNEGQSAAINKGLRQATGEIIAWLNSDDYYAKNTLKKVAPSIEPAKNRHFVMGREEKVNCNGQLLKRDLFAAPSFFSLLFFECYFFLHRTIPGQSSVFWSRDVLLNIGFLKTDLHFCMDYEYWLRALKAGYSFSYEPGIVSHMRIWENSNFGKSYKNSFSEIHSIASDYRRHLPASIKLLYTIRLCLYFLAILLLFPFRIISLVCINRRNLKQLLSFSRSRLHIWSQTRN